jgi:hypothetical protein
MIADLKSLFEKHLDQLIEEINAYKKEENLWLVIGGIKNSPGNLALHICGNLNHYIGATLMHTDYERKRDNEFSDKGVSREELIKKISDTKAMVSEFFTKTDVEILFTVYPKDYYGEHKDIGYVTSILIAHLAYHIGQINYHRRLLDA